MVAKCGSYECASTLRGAVVSAALERSMRYAVFILLAIQKTLPWKGVWMNA